MTAEQGPELARVYELLERVIAVEERLAEVVDRLTPQKVGEFRPPSAPRLRVVRERRQSNG